VREHTLGLARYVEKHGDFLDFEGQSQSKRANLTSLGARQRADSQAILAKILQEGAA
jgi:hypothetical protein